MAVTSESKQLDTPPSAEKDVGLPNYSAAGVDHGHGQHQEGAVRADNFYTRNGLNFESFKKRDYGAGIVELDRSMQPRHLQMIAIGGSIGAGFFVGSGGALHKGGPGSLLIDFLIIGIMMFNVVYALGELAVMYPWAVVLPLELTVCGFTVSYWNQEINVGAWITIFFVAILVVNIFGTLGYAEEEFWASSLKLIATVVFIIIAFVMVLGGGPDRGIYNQYWGARLWYDPGAFNNGFRGWGTVFVTAAFAFSGTELVGLAAAEAHNPVASLPSAIKQVFWRVTIFYVLGLLFVGLLVDSQDPRLLGAANSYADITASPFVIVGKNAGLDGFDSFMNVIILVSVLSIGVAAVYGGSRTLTAMAQQGYAPRIFSYIDKSGRPLPSVAVILLFGLLAYVSEAEKGQEVFDWLQALSGLAALFTWGSICYAHIRFRQAWKHHGHTLDEIPFQAIGGVYGSWLGLFLILVVLVVQFYTAVCPIGGGYNDAAGFFKAYLALPVLLVFWAGGFLWKRTGWLTLNQIDVDSGRRALDWDEINAFRAKKATWPMWKRILKIFF
ncbi:Amino-acid permease inda1 [Apiospora kogelbergensis]|uniref:Amino-acid permease inda1 n=1 Tax=Apiospora kogelbergensis TaxID=1337665 RepID=A0AAW0R612_9PEZI